MLDRLLHGATEFSEILDAVKYVVEVHSVDAGDEAYVVDARQTALKAAPEADRPRRLHVPLNGAFRLRQNAAENLNQRRLSLTIPPKHGQASSLAKFERQVAENLLAVRAFE